MSPVRGLAKRAAWSAAVRMGLQVYDPNPENLPRLEELTEYVEDPRPIGDERLTGRPKFRLCLMASICEWCG